MQWYQCIFLIKYHILILAPQPGKSHYHYIQSYNTESIRRNTNEERRLKRDAKKAFFCRCYDTMMYQDIYNIICVISIFVLLVEIYTVFKIEWVRRKTLLLKFP